MACDNQEVFAVKYNVNAPCPAVVFPSVRDGTDAEELEHVQRDGWNLAKVELRKNKNLKNVDLLDLLVLLCGLIKADRNRRGNHL